MKTDNYLKRVRDQYENYPYPQKDPEDEKTRLENIAEAFLERINFYCFKGKRDFHNFRVLIAGGGTGDATIFLAEQLRDKDSEVIYVDISHASMDIAKKRAELRGLTNITFVHGSLLDLPKMNLGKFDYINCSGVLHHLDKPEVGLKALKAVLKSDGAMSIMVYGKYGRMGIYSMQQLMKLINEQENNMQERIENTKEVLGNLPESNWFKKGEELAVDHKLFGDIGIYDLFLHSQEKTYSISEVYDLVESCKLNLIEFVAPRGVKQLLNPENHIKNTTVLEKIHDLDKRKKQEISELLVGNITKHSFFIANQYNTIADINDLNNVPFFFPEIPEFLEVITDESKKQVVIPLPDGNRIIFFKRKHTGVIFKYLNGTRSLKEIFEKVRTELKNPLISDKLLLDDFEPIYRIFNDFDLILLRDKSVNRFRSLQDMQEPVSEKYKNQERIFDQWDNLKKDSRIKNEMNQNEIERDNYVYLSEMGKRAEGN